MGYSLQDLSYHNNEMMLCLILHKTEKLAIRDNLGSVFEKICKWSFKLSKYNKNEAVLAIYNTGYQQKNKRMCVASKRQSTKSSRNEGFRFFFFYFNI